MDTAATVPEEGDDNPRVLRSLSSHLPVRHWQGHTVEMSASSLEEGTRRNSDGLEAGLLRNDFLRPAPLGGATHDSGLQGTRHWASTTQLRSPRRVEQEREHSAPLLSGSTSAPPGGEEAGGIASPSPAPVDRGAASHTGSASSLEQDPTQASAEGAGTEGAAPDAPPGQALKEEERSLSRKVFGLESEVPRKEPVAQVTECAFSPSLCLWAGVGGAVWVLVLTVRSLSSLAPPQTARASSLSCASCSDTILPPTPSPSPASAQGASRAGAAARSSSSHRTSASL